MPKITFEDDNGKYTIETTENYICFPDIVENLIIPVFRGAGFHEKTIEKYINQFGIDDE